MITKQFRVSHLSKENGKMLILGVGLFSNLSSIGDMQLFYNYSEVRDHPVTFIGYTEVTHL